MIAAIEDVDAESDETFMRVGGAFFNEGKMPGSFDPSIFRRTWRLILQHGIGGLWKAESGGVVIGGIGGTIFGDPNDGALVAQEMFWYIDEPHRGGMAAVRLLTTFENWAKARGAKRIQMAHLLELQPERIRDFYERRGYKAVEVIYAKAL